MSKTLSHIAIAKSEIKFSFMTASGPGGQNVNKVATAVQLRFDVINSASLPEEVRARLIALLGKQLTLQGELIIKASRYRTQERNKQDALQRLQTLVDRAATPIKKRKKSRPTFSSVQRRLESKKLHSKAKALRQNKDF